MNGRDFHDDRPRCPFCGAVMQHRDGRLVCPPCGTTAEVTR